MLRKYLISTEPGRMRRCNDRRCACGRQPRASARRTAPRRHRPAHRSSWFPSQASAEPRSSPVLAAAEEPHLAEILERRLDSTRTSTSSRCARFDLLVRHLDEIGALEHGGKRFGELRIGAFHRIGLNAHARDQLRIEIEIGVPQLFQAVEIFVVIDRRQQLADLPETLALGVVGKAATLDQRVEDVGFADRDEVASLVAGAARRPCAACCITARPRRTIGRRLKSGATPSSM